MSEIMGGRYDCPNPDCTERFNTLGDKRRHLRDNHGEHVKPTRKNGRKNRTNAYQ